MGAKMVDPNLIKYANAGKDACYYLKSAIKDQLRIVDEQDAINRYTWVNLPPELNWQLIERVLYFRGQGAFFYDKATNQFYFLPFALDDEIDIYGRYTSIKPLVFNGAEGTTIKNLKPVHKYITNKSLIPIYDQVILEPTPDLLDTHCIILKDYSEALTQYIPPRTEVQDAVLDVMADCVPFMRTALLNGTGVNGVQIRSEADKKKVEVLDKGITDAALLGKKYVPLTAETPLQELNSGDVLKSEDFLLAMQALDNYRLSLYGLGSGGLFLKKSHMLEAETAMNENTVSLIYDDGLKCRQDFCHKVNSLTGWDIMCLPREGAINTDLDGDGLLVPGGDE